MPEEHDQSGGLDDDEMAESIRYFEHDRSKKRVLSVVSVVAVAGILAAVVYLAYSETPEAAQEIEAAQPGGP